jgi:cbb3-type cytochrome oxidase maturation protein
MEIIYILLPASIIFSLISLVAYLYCAKTGQFDDLETPAIRAILEDKPKNKDNS